MNYRASLKGGRSTIPGDPHVEGEGTKFPEEALKRFVYLRRAVLPGEGAVSRHCLPQDEVIEAPPPAASGEDGVGAFPVRPPIEGLKGSGKESGPPVLPFRPEKVDDIKKIVARPFVQMRPS